MATVRPDGAPVTLACWYLYDGDSRVLLSSSPTARRVEHLRHNPRVALTILGDDWYTHLSLLGHVVEQRPDADLTDVDRLSQHYLGIPYPEREPGLTTIVELDGYHTYGSGFGT
jgi:general stress protein 26